MKFSTTLLLLVVVTLLAGAIYWQTRKEQAEHQVELALFEGVDLSRVQRIRVDNIERSYNLRLERDGAGVWYITDPITYPANSGVVGALLEDVQRARALVVSGEEAGARELGFTPPKIVLEVEEALPEGLRVHEVEIGATDLDGIRLNVRKDGRYLRTLVRLYTTLDRILQDYRSMRALTIPGDEVVEVHRTGRVQYELEDEFQDLEFHAYRDGLAWRATTPWQALLSAMDVGVVVYGATRLDVTRFVEDEVRDPAVYGFDVPEVRIDLKTGDGRGEILLLSRASIDGGWYAMRSDAPHIWALGEESALRLMYPSEAMVDLRFMRAMRREVQGLRLVSESGGELLLEREGEGWTVAERLSGGEISTPLIADAGRVEDELARLEGLELRPLPEGESRPREPEFRSAIYLDHGRESLGGRLAPEGDGVLFQRVGDELLLLADAWLIELAQTPMSEFRSRNLVLLVENETRGLRLVRGERVLEYERDERGIWRLTAEEAEEAEELLALLDPLIYLKAESFLPAETRLADPIEVVFERFAGPPLRYVLGTDADSSSLAEVGGAFSRLRVADLHARVAAMFE
jgi:hypothetical protein